MEYEIFISGIGGQGIQLIAKMLAVAATAEDRHVMLNAAYGGEMRGGKSLATVIIGDSELTALPVTAWASAALVLHPKFWPEAASRLRADGLILTDTQIAGAVAVSAGQTLVDVPAGALAQQIGNPLVSGMVLMAAFNALTGLVSQAALEGAMRQLVPAHRQKNIAANEEALRRGRELVATDRLRVPLMRLIA